MTLLTPFDPVFLLVALLTLLPPHFLPIDEIFDAASQLPFRPTRGAASAQDRDGDDQMGDSREDGRDCEEDVARLGRLECVRGRLVQVCETTGEQPVARRFFLRPARLTRVLVPDRARRRDAVPVRAGARARAPERQGAQADRPRGRLVRGVRADRAGQGGRGGSGGGGAGGRGVPDGGARAGARGPGGGGAERGAPVGSVVLT